jgi:hypothetical protein
MEERSKIEQLAGNVKAYLETRFDIVVLNLQDKLSSVISSVASVLVLALLSVFVIFFASVGAAWWIGQTLQNSSIGFFCVAGFYLLLTIIIVIFKDAWIKLPVINALLRKININETD